MPGTRHLRGVPPAAVVVFLASPQPKFVLISETGLPEPLCSFLGAFLGVLWRKPPKTPGGVPFLGVPSEPLESSRVVFDLE